MSLTRFQDARSGKDGPVSGAIIVIPISFDDVAVNETVEWSWQPPAGMKVTLVAANVHVNARANDPALTIGKTKGGTEVAASLNLTSTAAGQNVTLKAAGLEVSSSDILNVRVVADADDTAESVAVTLVAYVSAPPTSLLYR